MEREYTLHLIHQFGPEHDWEWFEEHGFIPWPKRVKGTYCKYCKDVRVPVYWEWMIPNMTCIVSASVMHFMRIQILRNSHGLMRQVQ